MASTLAVGFGVASVVIMWGAVLGAVERREKFVFASGIVLILLGPALVAGGSLPEAAGSLIAALGVLAVVASTVPLLRGSPAEA